MLRLMRRRLIKALKHLEVNIQNLTKLCWRYVDKSFFLLIFNIKNKKICLIVSES